MDDSRAFELWATIQRLDVVIATGIFERGRVRDPLFQAAFTEAMILLHDILQCAARLARRVDFDDHICETEATKDITDLVAKVRGACCHMGSGSRQVGDTESISAFNVVAGREAGFSLAGVYMGCDFDDDLACWFGGHRIYMKRHIFRAFDEAKDVLAESLPQPYAY